MPFRSTNKVLSNIDLTIIFPIWGFLYGGNSSTKDEGIPFKIVLDKIFEIIKVKNIPNKITKITAIVDTIVAPKPCIVPANKNCCNRNQKWKSSGYKVQNY